MNWKLKCLAFYIINYAPVGGKAHAWFQKRITRRYFPRLTQNYLEGYLLNVRNFQELQSESPISAFEFGAGSNLLTPLLISAAGANKVLVYDVKRLATLEQVNDAIRQLRDLNYGNPTNPNWPSIINLDIDLLNHYRINYIAPGDARRTGLPAESIDFISSISTLEHIPRHEINSILIECRRVLKPTGRMSFVIDYHDHYATADPSISRFNFFRYSDAIWKWFNPPNHYQNRMRHSDYEETFAKAGYRFIKNQQVIPLGGLEEVQKVPLANRFRKYSIEDLAGLNGLFLLEP
jgi:SAM-dependent methyltransferase